MAGFDLDATDKAIIRELQSDGRLAFTKLGPLVGLSQAATRQRVNRLLERGIMQVVAVTDPHKVGLEVQAMVCLRVNGDVRVVAAAVGELDEVEYVVITAGVLRPAGRGRVRRPRRPAAPAQRPPAGASRASPTCRS